MGEVRSPKPSGALSPQARTKQTLLVNFAAALERADEQVLPSVYAFVARSFGSTPAQLGLLTLARALAQALASPVGGIAGHCAHRGRVIGVGCLMWAACAAAFAFSASVQASLPLWAVGGVGLALVVPSTQSLVADMSSDAHRGRAFGAMHLASSTGGMLGALLATNLGAAHLLGIEGWRLAFLVMAAISAATGLTNFFYTFDPRFPGARAGGSGQMTARQALSVLRVELPAVMRIPTFALIVVQGIFGSIPWTAMVFLTLWLQLIGMSAAAASGLVATFLFGYAVGGAIGGVVGDAAAARWPRHGRIFAAQFSVATGIPFSLLLIKGLPRDGSPGTIALYALVLALFAAFKAWASPACNNPIFASIVPVANRTLLYALDRCFETALAACAAPLVGSLAQRAFGFDGSATPTGDRVKDLANADALGSALLWFQIVPWMICLVLYSALHWTYWCDRAAAAAKEAVLVTELSSAESWEQGAGEEHNLLGERRAGVNGSTAVV